MNNSKGWLFLPAIVAMFVSGCSEGERRQDNDGARIAVRFHHMVDGQPLVTDEILYENSAGNAYGISEIQWFVSDLTLHRIGGEEVLINSADFAHYVDTDLPETTLWEVQQDVPAGTYESVSFTFGIKGEKNKPYMFTDSPESEMLWPINLGGDQGGYHYMKLNGFWIDDQGQRTPFNFHLGVGQERDDEGNITGFIQNWFEVKLPASSFVVEEGEKLVVNVAMNIEEWFDNPNQYDHNVHGGKIMQNQEAMRMGVENGTVGVFTVLAVEEVEDFTAI
jgi:hypothetical protein